MEILDYRSNDVWVVSVAGKLDAATSPQLLARLTDGIGSGERKVVLNFRNLEYISSAGIRVLYQAGAQLEDGAGTLIVAGPNADVKRVLGMVNLAADYPVVSDVEDALKNLAS